MLSRIFLLGFVLLAQPLWAWTVEDTLAVREVEHLAVSPDGNQVLVTTKSAVVGQTESRYQNQLWLTENGQYTAVTPPESVDDIALGAWQNASHFSFVTKTGNKSTLWYTSTDGQLVKMTMADEPIYWQQWSPDGQVLAYVQKTPVPQHLIDAKMQKIDVIRVGDFPQKLALWVAHQDEHGQWVHTQLSAPDESVHPELPFWGLGGLAWSPDSQTIAYSHAPTPMPMDFRTTLTLMQWQTKARQEIAPDAHIFAPSFSPDGRYLAYIYDVDRTATITQEMHVLDLQNDTVIARWAPFEAFQQNILGWQDAQHLLYTVQDKTIHRIARLNIETGESTWFDDGQRYIDNAMANQAYNTIAFMAETLNQPPAIYYSGMQQYSPTLAAEINAHLPKENGRHEIIQWQNKNGTTIEGIFSYAKGYQFGDKQPLILHIHGGPMGVDAERFPHSLLKGDGDVGYLTEAGYAVLRVNFHGSTGYGKAFRHSLVEDFGGIDFDDRMAGIDRLIADGLVNPDRLGIMGWSYGGYSTAWDMSQTNRFKAGVAGAGFHNIISLQGTTDIPFYIVDYAGQSFWRDSDFYTKRSSVFQAQNINAPLLLVHGEKDVRVPVTQSIELYTALKMMDKPVEMYIYPRQPHGITEPKLQLDYQQRTLDWFRKYLG